VCFFHHQALRGSQTFRRVPLMLMAGRWMAFIKMADYTEGRGGDVRGNRSMDSCEVILGGHGRVQPPPENHQEGCYPQQHAKIQPHCAPRPSSSINARNAFTS
jgi:hypothetical protein